MFVDAQLMAQQSPTTFFAPPASELILLEKGQHVQVCAAGERFWVEITEALYPKFVGKVANDLLYGGEHGLKCDDVVSFEGRHVYKIYTGW